MMGDRERWNQRWRERVGELAPPSSFVTAQDARLPRRGRALDVGGGAGRHAVWLARRGLDVTLVDVSDLALERAERRAADAGVALRLVRADLDEDPLPDGTWDVIVAHHFLCRAQWPAFVDALAPGGWLLLCQPTVTNLERHERPGPAYLVEPGELDRFARGAGLAIVDSREGWTAEDRHEAELVARRAG